MNRIFLTTLLILGTLLLNAQNLKLFYETKNGGYVLYASNGEWYPVSISLDLDLTNMSFSGGSKKLFIVPSKNEKFRIGDITIDKDGSRYKFSYNYKYTMGDVSITDFDRSFEYDLPFQKGKSFRVFQGYNGSFSHQNENALDFSMPEGTEITAARDGVVVQVVQNNTRSCATEECKQYNNYVTILHSDGSFATYAHIKHNGSKVKPGDAVKKGDVIAYSGNTGWSSGPHLHFVCFTALFEKRNTLETKFKIDKGEQAVLLKQGNSYTRDY